MEIKDIIALIGIFASAVFSFWSLIVSRRNARKTLFINSVTASRVKWIETVRQSMAEYCGLIMHIGISEREQTSEDELFEQVDRLRYLIKLQLNRSAPIDKKIIRHVDAVSLMFEEDDLDTDKLDKMVERLVELTQNLLKTEWEKVKAETANGALSQEQKQQFQETE